MITTDSTPTPTTTYINVTPAQAQEWLKQNTSNRKLSKVAVEKYRRDMEAGRWKLTHEGIAFDSDGVIVDGQHRLMAVSQMPGDFTLKLSVTFNLEPVARKYVDQGRKRDGAGNLQMAGIKNATATAAAARLILLHESGLLFRDNHLRQMITVPHVEEWVENNMGLVNFANDHHRMITSTNLTPSTSRATFFILSRVDAEATVKFFHTLGTGLELAADDPIYSLRSRLLTIATKKARKPATRDEMGAVIKTWNLWRDGKKRRTPIEMHGYTVDKFPEPR